MQSSLTLLGLAYDDSGEIVTFAIGFDKQWIGSVNKIGRFFRATIGGVRGTGLTPYRAAEAAWRAKWGVEVLSCQKASAGANEPVSVPERVSVKTIEKGRHFQIIVDGKQKGEVRKQEDGSHLAVIGDAQRKGTSAITAARLAWAQSKGLV